MSAYRVTVKHVASAVLILVGAGCVAHAPPPIVSRHRGPMPLPEDTVTVSVAFGLEPEVFEHRKLGMLIAVEYQAREDLSLGVSTVVGTGLETPDFGATREGEPLERHWLIAGRIFGQWNVSDVEWAATTFGVGFGYLTTGLSYLTLDAGEAVGYPNDHVVPHAAGALAASIPLSRGRPFGAKPRVPTTELYVGMLAGVAVPLADTNNQLAAEAGMMVPLRGSGGDFVLSVGDAQSVTPE